MKYEYLLVVFVFATVVSGGIYFSCPTRNKINNLPTRELYDIKSKSWYKWNVFSDYNENAITVDPSRGIYYFLDIQQGQYQLHAIDVSGKASKKAECSDLYEVQNVAFIEEDTLAVLSRQNSTSLNFVVFILNVADGSCDIMGEHYFEAPRPVTQQRPLISYLSPDNKLMIYLAVSVPRSSHKTQDFLYSIELESSTGSWDEMPPRHFLHPKKVGVAPGKNRASVYGSEVSGDSPMEYNVTTFYPKREALFGFSSQSKRFWSTDIAYDYYQRSFYALSQSYTYVYYYKCGYNGPCSKGVETNIKKSSMCSAPHFIED